MEKKAIRVEPTGSSAASPLQPTGAAMAAFVAAGAGSLALGLTVLLNEAGLFTAPALHGPAGGVSGRTTIAVVAWLITWVVLHGRWRGRDVAARKALAAALVLCALGLLATFPPLWPLL